MMARPVPASVRHSRPLLLASVALIGVTSVMAWGIRAAWAQEGPNPSVTLTFGSILTVDDNKNLDPVSGGTTTTLDNRVGLVYRTETVGSLLEMNASGVLRFSDAPGESRNTSFDDRRVGLRYSREGANSTLGLTLSRTENDVAYFDPFVLVEDPDAPITTGDLTTSRTGSRADSVVGLRFAAGEGGPLALSFALNRRDRSYSNVTDPSFFDTTSTALSLGLTLRPVERTGISLTMSQTDYSAEDVARTDRQTRRVRFGVTHAMSPDMTVSFSLGKTWIDEEELVGGLPVATSRSGLNSSVGLSRDLANGSIGVTLGRDLSGSGNRTDLSFSRTLDLPRGSLAATLGTSHQSGGGSTVIGSLSYAEELPRGALRASLSRRGGTTEDGNDTTTTRANLGWSHALSPQGGIDLSIDYLDVKSDVVGDDRNRARLRLAYTWDLTPDWQLAGGYTRSESRKEASGTATSNAVFLSLQRAVTFAP
ncbi:MAG: hypothetical protein ACK4MS_08380 [Paracoccaceae bacterium]